jgi:carbon-monoxide dehydrogenase medium subunit
MKPAPFEYHRARDFAHAAALLAEHEGKAKLLAGGQSLLPMMNLRLARPGVLVDLGRIREGRHIVAEGGGLRIGALVRHADVEHYPLDIEAFRWLPTVMRLIGHEPIRCRGTIGGSIAHADAAAEWCLLATLLEARLVLVGPDSVRTVAAEDFFLGTMTTDLAPDEVLVEVQFPQGRARLAVDEITRRAGDFALASCGIAFDVTTDRVAEARVAFGGLASVPFRCRRVESALNGRDLSDVTADDLVDVLSDDLAGGSADGSLSEYHVALATTTFQGALSRCAEGGPVG